MGRALARRSFRTAPSRANWIACARHLAFGDAAALRNLLHHVAVAVTGGKIHLAIDVPRVLAQGLLDNAHRLDELAPVHRAQETEAADAVAHRNLIGGLLLVLRPHQLLDRQAGLGRVAAQSR